jgi:hypothetical protein
MVFRLKERSREPSLNMKKNILVIKQMRKRVENRFVLKIFEDLMVKT